LKIYEYKSVVMQCAAQVTQVMPTLSKRKQLLPPKTEKEKKIDHPITIAHSREVHSADAFLPGPSPCEG
jgi:hypothetical protein